MLLLHGFTGTWRMWHPVLPTLEANHDVLAPTLPGHHGGPVLHQEEVSIAALADGIEQILDEQGIETTHICGNSLGGWLSLELARRGRARSVVALSPAGAWREAEDLHRTSSMIVRSSKLGKHAVPLLRGPLLSSQARRTMLRDIMEHGDRMPPGRMLQMIEDATHVAILDQFVDATRRDGPFAGDMSHVDCHVRIAWGQNDRVIPADRYGRPLLDRVPGAEFIVLPGVGHVPMYDDPLLIASTILEVTLAVDDRAANHTLR